MKLKKIGIIAKDIPRAHSAVKKLAKWLSAKGRKVFIDRQTAAAVGLEGHAEKSLPSLVDMIIVLGGDGTLRSAARLGADSRQNVPLFGVNLGSLGFMAEVSLEELYDNLQKALAGKLRSEERMMLEARVLRNDRVVATTSSTTVSVPDSTSADRFFVRAADGQGSWSASTALVRAS